MNPCPSPPILRRVLYCRPHLHPSIRLLHKQDGSEMPRRIINEQQRRNGWNLDAYEEEDSMQQTKEEPTNRYEQNQQEALDQ